jgi:hypothetical protein
VKVFSAAAASYDSIDINTHAATYAILPQMLKKLPHDAHH